MKWSILITLLIVTSLVAVGVIQPAFAQVVPSPDGNSLVTSYQNVMLLPQLDLTSPQVVELQFPSTQERSFLITETDTLSVQPFQTKTTRTQPTSFSVIVNGQTTYQVSDKNTSTYVDLPFTAGETNEATILYKFTQKAQISGVNLEFADFSKSPSQIKIESVASSGPNLTLLDLTTFTGQTIRFPTHFLNNLTVTLLYSQPIRLTEAGVIEEHVSPTQATVLRFLAKPGKSYALYLNPDKTSTVLQPESGNLFAEPNPRVISTPATLVNPLYSPADTDSDQVPDALDNCLNVANADQADSNNNRVGDLCDDTDFDGVINQKDNCPEDANYNQNDVDGDGLGDVCDKEESRFTEQYPWLPWAAMSGTAVIISGLVLQMSKSKQLDQPQEPIDPEKPSEN